jgi:hemophore-related protein
VILAGVLGGLAIASVAAPTALAQPQCTAATLSSTLGPVASATGNYLANHPEANKAVTDAGALAPADAEAAIKAYFALHPQEWLELKAIARPLANLRQQCPAQGAQGNPPDLGRLFDAMAS